MTPNTREITNPLEEGNIIEPSPGEDGIGPQHLKYSGQQLHKKIYRLIEEIMEAKQNASKVEHWNHNACTQKKRHNKESVGKQLAVTISEDYQNRFRSGNTIINGLHNLEQIIQKTRKYDKEAHIIFIVLKSAFDAIYRKKKK